MKECYVLEIIVKGQSRPFLRVYEKYGQALFAGRALYSDPTVDSVKAYCCDVTMAFDCTKDNK